MMKNFLFIISITIFLISACTSNQKKEAAPLTLEDSTNQQIKSQIDKIVDELAPPDTDYTGEFFQKYETGVDLVNATDNGFIFIRMDLFGAKLYMIMEK
jgi:hypothetical protein